MKRLLVSAAAVSSLTLGGCATTPAYDHAVASTATGAALGAGAGKIASELLFESLVLGLLGGIAGMGLAWAALRLLVAIAPNGLPRVDEIGIDAPVLIFALLISLFAGLLFGSIPALKYATARLGAGLRAGSRTLSQTREQHRARNTLVVVQMALALVLLISSGLMIRTFRAMTEVQPGFVNPNEVQTLRISIPEAQVPDAERVVRMQETILRKVEQIPGVASIALTTSIPMDFGGSFDPVFAQDRNYREEEIPPIRRFKYVSPGFMKTLGTRMVAGRDFTWSDTFNRLPVAMISERFAREYWHEPGRALGKRIRAATTDDWREIVGVVADIRDDGVDKQPPTSVYWPILMNRFESEQVNIQRTLGLVIRTKRAGSESLMGEIRRAVWSVNANIPLAGVQTLERIYRRSMARTSFTLVMLGLAGGMALLLGIVGIYGVIAYSVTQRTREIGIRIALGASEGEMKQMFVRNGLMLAGAGVICGVVGAFALTRFMSSLLFGVKAFDPVTYLSACLALVATAALASYLPSRRAAAVDPADALRAE
jgi:predicted permease